MLSFESAGERDHEVLSQYPVAVCVLGGVRLLKRGAAIHLRPGSKAETLLSLLALYSNQSVGRNALLLALWPESNPVQAGQCLNSLVHSFHKLLGDALNSSVPIVRREGHYRLNLEAGIGVDAAYFDSLSDLGDQARRLGEPDTATCHYRRAVSLYHGDLALGADPSGLVEQERLRARYLSILMYLAQQRYDCGDDQDALRYALTVLQNDPCREDAHRLTMRCYMRRGERAQALRQYQLCVRLLQQEFSAPPEAATLLLFEHLRLRPDQFVVRTKNDSATPALLSHLGDAS